MRALLEYLPLAIVFFVFVSVVRGVRRLLAKMAESQSTPRPGGSDPAQAERTRRIQEEIRRKIAERRGATLVEQATPAELLNAPPVLRDEPATELAADPNIAALLVQQQRLADEMRALEAARVVGQRRAALAASLQTDSLAALGLLDAVRGDLLADLRDPSGLRRAIVLREVLGPPVALR